MSEGPGAGEEPPKDIGQERSVRVIARIRPTVDTDGPAAPCTLLSNSQASISLRNPQDPKAIKQFGFDAVLGVGSTQEDLYQAARVDELAAAVVSGFHATVFAYGQTGSGKTYSMEGYRYITPGAGASKSQQNTTSNSSLERTSNPSVKASNSRRSVPHADFESTPPERLGLVPRAVQALFAAAQRSGTGTTGTTGRRVQVKVSFVQLYQEQVYDLLNPSGLGLGLAASQGQSQGTGWGVSSTAGSRQGLPGRPLHMRWTKAQEFYLENLFKVDCSSSAEVMAAFRQGVQAKVMASHALNVASSRSHALLTLYVESHPLASPAEVTSSRMTLVDLAGSERGNSIGASQGVLHDESVAINKSLFTLRKVIVALSATQSRQQQAAGTPHVPYRDSKLTALLKQSLGGNSLTTMIACVACVDSAYEENLSTLDYAVMARRVVNQVAVNEDPRTRVIRELRQEVSFLRAQLAALQAPLILPSTAPPASPATTSHTPVTLTPSQPSTASTAAAADAAEPVHAFLEYSNPGSRSRATASTSAADNSVTIVPAMSSHGENVQGVQGLQGSHTVDEDASAGHSSKPHASGAAAGNTTRAAGGGMAEQEEQSIKEALIRAAELDVRVIVDRLVSSAALVQHLSTANQELRSAYVDATARHEAIRITNTTLQEENAALRDRLDMIEGMAGVGPRPGASAGQGAPGSAATAAVVHTAGAAALIELQELRQENALLHMRLQAAEFAPGHHPSSSGAQVLVLDSGKGGTGQRGVKNSKGLQRAASQNSTSYLGHLSPVVGGSKGNVSLNPTRRSQSVTTGVGASGAGVLSSGSAVLSVSDLRAMIGSRGATGGGGVRPGSVPAGKTETLSARTHQLASQNLLSVSRVTTTGGMLAGCALARLPQTPTPDSPSTPVHTALLLTPTRSSEGPDPDAQQQEEIAGQLGSPSLQRQEVAGEGGTEAAAALPGGEQVAARLAHLMAARNALARGRVGGMSQGGG